jgi:ABC-type glycerol-3-phosphate transport system substrate-binding protein
VLPDVAIVDAFELAPLVRAGVATPLQDLVSEELVADLFPFAQQACTFGDDLIALQFEADIEHAIYYTRTLETPPATWADLFASPISYTFPAGGENGLVNDAFLIQYLAQEAQLLDEEGKAALEHSPVQRVLRLYDAVRKYYVSPSKILDIADLEECWEAYTEGNITISHISSWRYLTSRAVMQDTSFAAVPTETGRTATMSRGWALVIITQSPHRQEAAVRLIEWLMTSQNLAEWSLATNHLPTRSAALPLTGWPDDYTQFLEIQLESAFYRPSTLEFDRIARAFQVAVEDVLTGEETPRRATSQLMDSLE